jgi:hypothetical protein
VVDWYSVSEKVAVSLHSTSQDGEDWWAECLLCRWVTTANPDRRTAGEKFGRHYEREHRTDDRYTFRSG